MLSYFFSVEKFDTSLIQFINEQSDLLNFEYRAIEEIYGEGTSLQFINAVISCNELSDEKYENIFKTLNCQYDSFGFTGISKDKVKILIRLHVIRMSADVLEFLRENYPDNELIKSFIEQNILEYVELIDVNEDIFDLYEMLSVLTLEVDDEYKIDLINWTTEPISIKQKGYSDNVKTHILNENFDTNDIPYILSAYPTESEKMKAAIQDIVCKNIAIIIREQYPIPIALFSNLIVSDRFSKDTKIELFLIVLSTLNESQCIEYLSILKLDDYLSLFDGKRPKFEVYDINEQLLTIFKQKDWISSFDFDKDNKNYYRAYGRRYKRKKLAIQS